MKIRDAKTYVVANPPPHHGGPYFLFVKLTTDDNLHGYGEVYGAPFAPGRVVHLIEDVVEQHVIGWNPFQIEKLWRIIYARGYTQHPDLTLSAVLSGVEIACWDLVGKALGQPIYNLLGGRVHERLRSYTYLYAPKPGATDTLASTNVFGDAELAPQRAAAYVTKGFTAVKFDPMARRLHHPPGQAGVGHRAERRGGGGPSLHGAGLSADGGRAGLAEMSRIFVVLGLLVVWSGGAGSAVGQMLPRRAYALRGYPGGNRRQAALVRARDRVPGARGRPVSRLARRAAPGIGRRRNERGFVQVAESAGGCFGRGRGLRGARGSGDKQRMLHNCDIRNSLEEPITVPALFKVMGQVAVKRLPKCLRGGLADRLASDDSVPPCRGAGVDQDRSRMRCVGESPVAKQLFGASRWIPHRLVIDDQSDRSSGMPTGRREPRLDLLAFDLGQEWWSTESTEQSHGSYTRWARRNSMQVLPDRS